MTYPIILGVKRKLGAGNTHSKKSPQANGAPAKAEDVLRRDDYTCQYCSFRATRWQRVMPRDWATAAKHADAMVTACTFCEQCFSLETVSAMGSGTLIWLPEISQVDLNHVARAIYIAKAEGGDMAALATRALDALMARRADAKRRVGGDDPMLLATVLLENLDDKEYAGRAEKLDGIRLMPLDRRLAVTARGDNNQFMAMLNFWRSPEGPYARLPAKQWQELLGSTTSSLARA
jgi:intracellular multiplication protein IcmJ